MQETMTFPLTRQGVRNLDAVRGRVLPVSGGPAPGSRPGVNVGDNERFLSSIGGGVLVLLGLRQRSLAGLGVALVGGALLYRGVSGQCQLYKRLGVNTATRGSTPPGAEIVYRPG